MSSGYVEVFANKMRGHVLTTKLDGQNDCLNKRGVYARSHANQSAHEWDKPIIKRWELMKNDLGDIDLFCENLFACHSLSYSKLESFLYVFAVREKGRWLSWEEVCFYAALYDLPTVPVIPQKISLKDFWKQNNEKMDENKLLAEWFALTLGKTWEEYCDTEGGELGGYDVLTGKPATEGFVLRNIEGFETNVGLLPVASNEFDSLFKIVRKGHVTTDSHWTKNWKPASLIDTEKYKWFGMDHYNFIK